MPKPFDPERHCGNTERRHKHQVLFNRITRYEAKLAKYEPESQAAKEINELLAHLREQAEPFANDLRICTKPKGYGTNHYGKGLCMYHCECKGKETGHNFNVKIGPYRYIDNDDVKRRIGAIVISGDDPMDLEPHLIALTAILTAYVESKKDLNLTSDDLGDLLKLIDQIGKMVERINQQRLKTAVSWDAVTIMMEKMGAVVKDVVTDPEDLDRILNGWRNIDAIDPNARLRIVE